MDFAQLTLISPAGAELDLNDPAAFLAVSCDGLGLPPLHRLSVRGPLQHGHTGRGFRLDPRRVRLTIKVRAATPEGMYERRAALLQFFQPASDPLILRATLPGGAVRQVDCTLEGGLQFDSAGRTGTVFETPVLLSAASPAFYDPQPNQVTLALAPSAQVTFPAGFPLMFGSGWCSLEQVVAYPGSWQAHPRLTLLGPFTSPVITIGSARLQLDYSLDSGERVVIDTRPGWLSAFNNLGQTLIGRLSPDSDLAGFSLLPGENVIRFEGTGAQAGSTQVTLEWFTQYLGI